MCRFCFCCRHRKIKPIGAEFNYRTVRAKGFIRIDDYTCTAVRKWITLTRNDAPEVRYGWKIHISLDDEISGNIEKAWNVLVGLFIAKRINLVKLIDKGDKDITVHPNYHGRQITIYSDLEPFTVGEWREILQEINDELVRAGVFPGYISKICQPIEGSSYFSYRNDDNGRGEYLDPRAADAYKLLSMPDPYDRITITPLSEQMPSKQYVQESREDRGESSEHSSANSLGSV